MELNPERKKLVYQLDKSREERLSEFEAKAPVQTDQKAGNYYIPTNRGELVRSMTEFNIANTLYRFKVPYIYEYSFRCKDGTVLHPDFYVFNKATCMEYLWEHFGMMDKPDYVRNNMMYKIRQYAENGIILGKNLIATFSDGTRELTIQEIKSN